MSIPIEGRVPPLAPGTFRALSHRNFRLYWIGQFVSLTGSWMQSLAQGWLVLRLTNSPFQLGVVGFFAFLPILLFTLAGGLAADRFPRRRALLWTQGLAAAQAAALAGLTWSGRIQVWEVAALAFVLGTIHAFDIPIRQAFLHEMTSRDNLQNAIALNSVAFNSARLIGPAVAGIVLAASGEAACFTINAVSYLAVLAALAAIRVPPVAAPGGDGAWLAGIRDGVVHAWRSRPVRRLLLLVAASSVFGVPYSVLMPAVARDVLGGDQKTLGFLMGTAGGGAILGALLVAGRRATDRPERMAALGMAVFGGSLVAFSFSRSVVLSAAILLIVGGAVIVQMSTSNAFVQLAAPPALRGRIVSLYALMFLGMTPFGSLLSGFLARQLGTPAAIGIGGFLCLAVAIPFVASTRASVARRGGAPP